MRKKLEMKKRLLLVIHLTNLQKQGIKKKVKKIQNKKINTKDMKEAIIKEGYSATQSTRTRGKNDDRKEE